MFVNEAIQPVAQAVVAFAYAHCNGELELLRRKALIVPDRLNRQRHRRALREIAGQRTPGCGDIDVAVLDRLDQARRRIDLTIVAIDRVAADIVDDALFAERLRGRRIVAVIADQMHADHKLMQARIEQ